MKRIYVPTTAAALAAVFALAVSGISWAEGMGKGMSQGMNQGMDQSKNQMTEKHTLTQQEQNAFSHLDKNGDGKISKEEAKQSKNLNSQFGQADSNKDNNIDEGEFARFEMETGKSE